MSKTEHNKYAIHDHEQFIPWLHVHEEYKLPTKHAISAKKQPSQAEIVWMKSSYS
jgi:hypothetical protein